jgi:disulfide bond formation protein DsbB
MNKLAPRLSMLLVGAACVAAVGAAVFAQYHLKMQPCPWCILQRILFLLIAVLAFLSAGTPGLIRRSLSALILPAALAGIGSALWQHFVAAKSQSCALTTADRIITWTGLDAQWPSVFEVRGSCADAVSDLLGIPFEFWSLLLFAVVGLIALRGALAADRRA